MSTITRTYLQALVSKTATFAGSSVDVSGLSTNATLVIRVQSFDAANTARIQVTDSADGFSSDIVAVTVQHIQGGETASADLVFRIPWYDIPDARFGVSSAHMKAQVTSISGGTLTYEVWIES
jgi:hypothetical protein